MQTQQKYNLLNIMVMLCMVFSVVFAPSLKAAIDSIDMAKKTTSQQLLEEESHEKESKAGKEVYTKYSSFQDSSEENYNSIRLSCIFYSPLKITLPYLKVHTPPPDLSFLV
ncbi:hypothetical protein FHR24_000653 [Wenyingzhuangia heitensis]|uniref:Uncharacterized protein n=1 Tax=Wenyingzhuangia heitensis TaxID=1487859 RepID=A0ABX0U7A1_9FLAO|nr:hypothetical protein [Wenyingzhuangia heitensis]NIJ44214.1 hypothetical protein [Wenyingzhuangia heitensis]